MVYFSYCIDDCYCYFQMLLTYEEALETNFYALVFSIAINTPAKTRSFQISSMAHHGCMRIVLKSICISQCQTDLLRLE